MQPAWIARIKRGDVLKSRGGVLRVVRQVTHSRVKWNGPEHIRTNVAFAIRHCSWTRRPYTILSGNDLVQMGYRPTRACVKLNKKIDRLIEYNMSGRDGMPVLPDFKYKNGYATTCCDVEGVA